MGRGLAGTNRDDEGGGERERERDGPPNHIEELNFSFSLIDIISRIVVVTTLDGVIII